MPSTPADQRIAGAPISWGVCEVPGWGHQLAPDRVLTEMREVGLAATEVGPDRCRSSQKSSVVEIKGPLRRPLPRPGNAHGPPR